MQKLKLVNNLLVLVVLTGAILAGWLAGHILRYIIPAYQHPPIEEIDPHIENGFKFEGIRRQVVLIGNPAPSVFSFERTVYLEQILFDQCLGSTYYTSLPAKCHSVDRRLVRVDGTKSNVIVIPRGK
jgi:hypothetical protein